VTCDLKLIGESFALRLVFGVSENAVIVQSFEAA